MCQLHSTLFTGEQFNHSYFFMGRRKIISQLHKADVDSGNHISEVNPKQTQAGVPCIEMKQALGAKH